jgi:hypothetical protein
MARLIVNSFSFTFRLKKGERYGVIGGDKLGRLTSQPPDRVYWTALRQWGLLLPSVGSRSKALRRLRAHQRCSHASQKPATPFPRRRHGLPRGLDARADSTDKQALGIAKRMPPISLRSAGRLWGACRASTGRGWRARCEH